MTATDRAAIGSHGQHAAVAGLHVGRGEQPAARAVRGQVRGDFRQSHRRAGRHEVPTRLVDAERHITTEARVLHC